MQTLPRMPRTGEENKSKGTQTTASWGKQTQLLFLSNGKKGRKAMEHGWAEREGMRHNCWLAVVRLAREHNRKGKLLKVAVTANHVWICKLLLFHAWLLFKINLHVINYAQTDVFWALCNHQLCFQPSLGSFLLGQLQSCKGPLLLKLQASQVTKLFRRSAIWNFNAQLVCPATTVF